METRLPPGEPRLHPADGDAAPRGSREPATHSLTDRRGPGAPRRGAAPLGRSVGRAGGDGEPRTDFQGSNSEKVRPPARHRAMSGGRTARFSAMARRPRTRATEGLLAGPSRGRRYS